MATTTLLNFDTADNGKATPQTASDGNDNRPNLVELRAAIFAALGKIAGDEGERDDLTDGSAHTFELSVSGQIDGSQFGQAFAGRLTVGHASERASSVGPDQDHLLAYVLGKLNTATREAIYRDTASDFAAAGGQLPACDDAAIEAAKSFRAGLRQKVSQHVRGSVRVEYAAVAAAPAVAPAAAPAKPKRARKAG